MQYIERKQITLLKKFSIPGKAVMIYGPRRCGKTTLLKKYLEESSESKLYVTGEDVQIKEILSSHSLEKIRQFIGTRKILAIDEAQKIPDIGENLKLALDNIPDLRIFATGSSSFDLAHQTGEPLTGRKFTVKIFPLSLTEIAPFEENHETASRYDQRIIYGMYPEVYLEQDTLLKQNMLKEIVSSYLYKDILELDGLKHSSKIIRLLQLLAFQVGKEVSHTELGTQLGISKNTVERYLELLEKAFVLIRLTGFNRNLRKEISKLNRYFFYDNGILNVLINNFNPPTLRSDSGALWENFSVIEMIKAQEHSAANFNNYFWRTTDKKEIDFVTERNGQIVAYEIKYTHNKGKPPKIWQEAYPDSHYECVTRENLMDIINKHVEYN